MAFPTIPTTGAGRILTTVQANATSPRTFPSLSSLTKNAGDLLIAIIAAYDSTTASPFGTWGGGFTEFRDTTGGTGNMLLGLAYKFSTGSETGTFTVVQAATITGHAAMILMSIPLAHPTEVPTSVTVANNTTSAADPTQLFPSWGSAETLWISVAGIGETSTAGAFDGLTTAPTNYGNQALSSISGDVVGGVQVGVAFRQLEADNDNVVGWTLDTSNARNAATVIAVRPQPPVQLPFVVKPQFWRWL